ncbi:MAG: S8 family serine peptidase, partial [Crocinitomicaceae bacterium]
MKTHDLLKKPFRLILVLLMLCQLNTYAQSTFRVEITNPGDIPEINENPAGDLSLQFADPNLQQLFNNYTITVFTKEFPMFPEEPGLKDYFVVEADSIGLYTDLLNLNYFPNIEVLEGLVELAVPSDYTPFLPFINANVPGAWMITEGSPSVKIGVLDTPLPIGTAATQDIECQLEYTRPGSIGTPTSSTHGASVSQIIAGAPNNGLGSPGQTGAGIAGYAKLYYAPYTSAWAIPVQDFVERGARVINISATSGCTFSPVYQLFIDRLAEKGVIIVAAAGNGELGLSGKFFDYGSGPICQLNSQNALCSPNYTGNSNAYIYPAAYDNVISVTGTLWSNDNLYLNVNVPLSCGINWEGT